MQEKPYRNILFTGESQIQFIRLVSGKPSKILNHENTKGLVFSEGQIFCYMVSQAGKLIAWIVKNNAGMYEFPYLEKPALLLLEAAGKMRVKRLVKTIQFIEESGYDLSDFTIDTFIQLDSLLAGRSYRKEWIIEKVSHGKL